MLSACNFFNEYFYFIWLDSFWLFFLLCLLLSLQCFNSCKKKKISFAIWESALYTCTMLVSHGNMTLTYCLGFKQQIGIANKLPCCQEQKAVSLGAEVDDRYRSWVGWYLICTWGVKVTLEDSIVKFFAQAAIKSMRAPISTNITNL